MNPFLVVCELSGRAAMMMARWRSFARQLSSRRGDFGSLVGACFVVVSMQICVNEMLAKNKPEVPRVVRFTVPHLTPPSVNHYKKPVRIRISGGETRQSYAVTAEGKAFKQAVCLFARGASVVPIDPKERKAVRYGLYVVVVHGKGETGDGDNYWKCIADGLEEAGVIHSDNRVKVWYLRVEDEDRENPRTEIRVSVLPPLKKKENKRGK